MADKTKTILSLCATTSSRLSELTIKNGQLIFVQDSQRIAMDFNGKRKFYNQVEELQADAERTSMESPVNGLFYFVIETAVLWRYYNEWIQVTTPPDEIVFIGTELPELGQPQTLYVDKKEREISVWDEDTDKYIPVSNYTYSINPDEVAALFGN
jgi:hypothetical protein